MDVSSSLDQFPVFQEPLVSTKETHKLGEMISPSSFSGKEQSCLPGNQL